MFLFNKRQVPYCKYYKYLGCHVNEHLEYDFTTDMLADSAGGALSMIISKMIKNKGFPYVTYSMLYNSCVLSISHYGGEIFGYSKYNASFKLQLRACRAFLGLPKNVTSYGLLSEMDWFLPHFQGHLKMIQYYGRILHTASNRLMYKVFLWAGNLMTLVDYNPGPMR